MNTSSIEEKEKEPVKTATIVGIVSIVLMALTFPIGSLSVM